MGYNIGCPTLKLTRASMFGKKQKKHHGNYKAIPLECLSERYCKDPDCDKSKTADNLYFKDFFPKGFHFKDGRMINANFTSGEEVSEYWNELANNYTYKTKDGKTKTVRSDAVIGFAGIFKPEKAMLDKMTDDEKFEFFKISIVSLCNLYSKKGMTMDYIVLHKDEQQWHLHYGGHDDDYKLCEKISPKLWRSLNRDIPKALNKHGYEINDLVQYDPNENLTEEELAEYKEKHRERKRKAKSGRSSSEYKAEKTIEALKEQEQSANATLKALNAQISDFNRQIADLPSQEDIDALKREYEALKRDIQKGEAIKNAIINDIQGLKEEQEAADADARKAVEERNKYQREAKVAKQSYDERLKNRVRLSNTVLNNKQNGGSQLSM